MLSLFKNYKNFFKFIKLQILKYEKKSFSRLQGGAREQNDQKL